MKQKTLLTITLLILTITIGAGSSDFDPFAGDVSGQSESGFIDKGPTIPEIQFDKNEISMAFQIISDAAGWSIIPSHSASNVKISLWAKNITAADLLEKVILLANLVYHKDGNIISVMTYDEYLQYHGLDKKHITLENANPDSVIAVVKPFLSKLGKIQVHKDTSSLTIYDSLPSLMSLIKIIDNLDQPAQQARIEIIELTYADSGILCTKLNEIFTLKQTEKNTEEITEDKVSIVYVERTNRLIIQGRANDVQKVAELARELDKPTVQSTIEIVELVYADSKILSEKLNEIFAPKNTEKNTDEIVEDKVSIIAIERTNRLIIQGRLRDVNKVIELAKKLDVYTESTTKNYHLTYVDASEVFGGLERIIGSTRFSQGSSSYRSEYAKLALMEKSNSILLTGPPSVHRIMQAVIEDIDEKMPYEAGLIQVYKIDNADVGEIAAVISQILDTQQEDLNNKDMPKYSAPNVDNKTATNVLENTGEFIYQVAPRVAVNKSTNSVIVQASARIHRELEKLITQLDKRRKQVLIKAMIVEIITGDDFEFGVEISFDAKLTKTKLPHQPHWTSLMFGYFSPHRHDNINPSFLVDITEYQQRKFNAILAYKSQMSHLSP
jgi:type II secretory pathway component GspD/PulD (secretin)